MKTRRWVHGAEEVDREVTTIKGWKRAVYLRRIDICQEKCDCGHWERTDMVRTRKSGDTVCCDCYWASTDKTISGRNA